MFFIRFFRYLLGYISFSGNGGFPERFLNLCSQMGIAIWDAKSSMGKISAKTTVAGYKKILTPARRSGMKLKITKKSGLPFLINPYKKRYGIFSGVAVSAVILVLMTSTVWSISVSGNEKYTDSQIVSIAEHYGVKPGKFRNSIDIKQIRSDIKTDIDGISWFSVNIDGGRVFLETSETSGSNEILDLKKPCNILSGTDGELLSLEVYTGQAEVSPGSAVIHGDLLISGVVEKTDGSAYFQHARGVATVRTNKKTTAAIPLSLNIKRIDKLTIVKTIYFFGLKIPLGFSHTYDSVREENNMLSFRGVTLPVGFITKKYSLIKDSSETITEQQGTLLSGYILFSQEKSLMKNAETEKKNVKITLSNNSINAVINYINHEKTGIEQYFEVE